MNLKKLLFIALTLVTIGSCKKYEERFDSLLDNPNVPRPDAANADLYLTQVQLSFADFFNTASSFGMELTRYIVFYGPTYAAGYSPTSYDGI